MLSGFKPGQIIELSSDEFFLYCFSVSPDVIEYITCPELSSALTINSTEFEFISPSFDVKLVGGSESFSLLQSDPTVYLIYFVTDCPPL